jgi:hypothetical protein
MTHIVPATAEHVAELVKDVRGVDCLELKLFLGKDPEEAMYFILDKATKAWTAVHKGKVALIFGYNVTSCIEKVAAPFMIATEHSVRHPLAFARHSRVAQQYFEGYFMMNYVLDGNVVAKKWLKWLGFHLGGVQSMTGYPVRMFTKDCR